MSRDDELIPPRDRVPGRRAGKPMIQGTRRWFDVVGDDIDAATGQLMRPVADACAELDHTGGRAARDLLERGVGRHGEAIATENRLVGGGTRLGATGRDEFCHGPDYSARILRSVWAVGLHDSQLNQRKCCPIATPPATSSCWCRTTTSAKPFSQPSSCGADGPRSQGGNGRLVASAPFSSHVKDDGLRADDGWSMTGLSWRVG